MSRKKVTHSEAWWMVEAPAHVVRCERNYKTGLPCRREAVPGTTVCREHGGAAPQILAAAGARLQNAADRAAEVMVEMIDNAQDERNRIVASKDVLDRTGFVATNKVLLGVVTDDPIEKLFRDLLSDPANLASTDASAALALPPSKVDDGESSPLLDWNREDDIVDAEVVEDDPIESAPVRQDSGRPRRSHGRRREADWSSKTMPKHIREAMEDLL